MSTPSTPARSAALAALLAAALALGGTGTAGATPVAATAAAADGVWVPAVVVDPEAGPAGAPASPEIAGGRAQDGGGAAAWTGGASADEVRVSVRAPGRGWSEIETIPAAGSVSGLTLDDGMTGRGAVWVAAWLAGQGERAVVQASVRAPRGVWSAPRTLSEPGDLAGPPALAVVSRYDRDGWTNTPYLHWRAGADGAGRIRQVTLDPRTGEPNGRWLTAAGSDVEDPAVTVEFGTDHTVSWSRKVGSRWQAEWIHPGVGPVESLALAGEDLRTPRWTTYGLVWTDPEPGGTRVRGILRRGPGRPWTEPVTLSSAGVDADALTAERAEQGPERVFATWRETSFEVSRVVAATGTPATGAWTHVAPLSPESTLVGEPVQSRGLLAWPQLTAGSWVVQATRLDGATWEDPVPLSGESSDALDVAVVHAATGVSELGGPGVVWVEEQGGPEPGRRVLARGLDDTPPAVRPTTYRSVTTDGVGEVPWTAGDDWSGIAEMEAQARTWRRGADGWTSWTPVPVEAGPTGTVELPLAPGDSSCVRLRATDGAGWTGDWSLPGCVGAPVDDRDLRRSGTWREGEGRAWFAGTHLTSRQRGASLRLDVGSTPRGTDGEVHLVARVGPAQGRVALLFGGQRREVVDLAAVDGRGRVAIPVWWNVSHVDGPLVLRVVSSGKPVRIDGVAYLRTRDR